MRALAALALIGLTACGSRQVEVRTAPTQTSDVAIHFTNNLAKTVNVYVNAGESDLFIRQVAGHREEHLPVPGLNPGVQATLKAKPIDGSAGYEKSGVTLTQVVAWTIP